MQLKQIALTGLVIGSMAIPAAAASNKKPVTQWTCADFLAVEDQFRPKVVYAATAYSKAGKPEAEVIDIEGTEKVTPMSRSEECAWEGRPSRYCCPIIAFSLA